MRAAGQGLAEAQYNLALRYYNGEGVRQDYAEAVRWVRLAAEQGDARAQANLGVMYGNGEGVPQDYVEAPSGSTSPQVAEMIQPDTTETSPPSV